MEIQGAYNQWAASYDEDRNLTRDLDRQVTRELLGGRHFDAILELGCGTGKNTLFLAEIGAGVRALDFSEEMLRRAREKVTAPHVTFALADLTRPWPCAGHSADLVAGNLVLEHIAELGFIFGEAARVLQVGGLLFLSELHPYRQYQGSVARFQRGEEITCIGAFVHHLSDFTRAAAEHGLTLHSFHEWWHAEDQGKPPRLVSFVFGR
jgi:ubiquinone/menaquinone biosynthesis C-methylase UbiE